MQTEETKLLTTDETAPTTPPAPTDKPPHTSIHILLNALVAGLFSLAAMVCTAAGMVPAALEARGYFAIGGEGIAVPLVGLAVWFLMLLLLKTEGGQTP